MGDFLLDAAGVFPAIVIMLCQLFVGTWISRKCQLKLSLPSRWSLGICFFALINILFLAINQGQLVHINLLGLLLFFFLWPKPQISELKPFALTLSVITLLFTFANVLNPMWLWDAQSSWMGVAKNWHLSNHMQPHTLSHVFDTRPQMVSVIYFWGLKWGNETTCQFLDLMFYLGFLAWLGQHFKCNNKQLALVAIISLATVFHWNKIYTGKFSDFYMSTFVGTGSSEFILCLLLVALVELIQYKKNITLGFILIALVFLNCRMNALIIYVLLNAICFWQFKDKKKTLAYLLVTPILASPWYLWNWQIHGNPFFPHAADLFNNIPSNSLLQNDSTEAGMALKNIQGIRDGADLLAYIKQMGWLIVLFPLCLLLKIEKRQRNLLFLVLSTSIVTAILTSQLRFQIFSLTCLAAFLVMSKWRFQKFKYDKFFIISFLVVFALPNLKFLGQQSLQLLADARNGKAYLMETRVRLYPAIEIMNELQANKQEPVLWPFNPHYYAKFPVIRSDDAAYLLSEDVLGKPKAVRDQLYEMGIRWIVKAKPYHNGKEHGMNHMENYVAWITEHDGDCEEITTIEASGVSPETKIYRLKAPQK